MRKFERQKPKSTTIEIDSHNKVKNYTHKRVQHELRKELLEQSKNHCMYCDNLFDYRLLTMCIPQIEHFKPIRIDIGLKDDWYNLFISCEKCNLSKHGKYNETNEPYKPDVENYQFEKYFQIDSETYEIKPLNHNDKRAIETIKWLGLNGIERCAARKQFFKYIENRTSELFYLDDLSYRFVYEYFVLNRINYCPNIR